MNESGCSVLLCNLSSEHERKEWTAESLLELYKNQGGIEQNFGFLKDPVIVNSIFLKKPTRIEVPGLVLIIALLIWRLMAHIAIVINMFRLKQWKAVSTIP